MLTLQSFGGVEFPLGIKQFIANTVVFLSLGNSKHSIEFFISMSELTQRTTSVLNRFL
jgi:hypothetical protein